MKRTLILITAVAFALGTQAQAIYKATKYHAPIKVEKKWKKYNPGDVEFHDEAPESEGSKIYHNIIPNPAPYIQENALRVLQTLYWGPKDPNVPRLKRIVYTIKDYNGISEKYGSGDYVGIRYSTNWIERCFALPETTRCAWTTKREASSITSSLTPTSSRPKDAESTTARASTGSSSKALPMPYASLAAASTRTSRARTARVATPGVRVTV